MKFRKGDIVGRLSYNKDIVFTVSNIIKCRNQDIAILKGLVTRIEADSPLDDLELIDNNRVIKAQKVYKSMGLNVIVKNIPESKQPQMIWGLLGKYNPDILVVTGHDGMIKKGYNFNDIYNYRNSKYFVETVIRARMWEQGANKLAIFAGACQSYYEAIMEAGANFASSPARILIDFKDPLVVAGKIATTDFNKYVTINDIKNELRDGENGVSGIGAHGKKRTI